MTGWTPRGRDLYFVPPDVGGSVRIGEIDWVESLSLNSAEGCIHVSLGNNSYAPYGAFSGSRTSDGGGIGHMALAYQDSKSNGGGAWGHYVECFVAPDADQDNTAFGVEYAIVNKRPTCGDVNPYQISNWGMVDGVRVGVGKPGDNGQEISSLMTFTNVENSATAVARKGLVFAANVLKFVGGIANAINFAMGHAIRWFDQYGRPGHSICAEAGSNSDYASHIKMGNGAIHFAGADGVNQFSFNTITGNLYLGNTGWSTAPLKGYVGSVSLFVGGRKFRVPLYED